MTRRTPFLFCHLVHYPKAPEENMKKSELVKKIVEQHPSLSIQEADYFVNIVFDKIARDLKQSKRIEIRGFGVFATKQRQATLARNPKTGEKVHVPETKVPFFKISKSLTKLLNDSNK